MKTIATIVTAPVLNGCMVRFAERLLRAINTPSMVTRLVWKAGPPNEEWLERFFGIHTVLFDDFYPELDKVKNMEVGAAFDPLVLRDILTDPATRFPLVVPDNNLLYLAGRLKERLVIPGAQKYGKGVRVFCAHFYDVPDSDLPLVVIPTTTSNVFLYIFKQGPLGELALTKKVQEWRDIANGSWPMRQSWEAVLLPDLLPDIRLTISDQLGGLHAVSFDSQTVSVQGSRAVVDVSFKFEIDDALPTTGDNFPLDSDYVLAVVDETEPSPELVAWISVGGEEDRVEEARRRVMGPGGPNDEPNGLPDEGFATGRDPSPEK
jgi:hypothetical protein